MWIVRREPANRRRIYWPAAVGVKPVPAAAGQGLSGECARHRHSLGAVAMLLMLETDRLILRPFQDSDLQPFVAYRSDPAIARYQGWDAPYSIIKATEFIEEMKRAQPGIPGQWYQIAIALKNTGEMIGDSAFCVLADDERQAEIGFTLAGPYQGYGYATEAVTALLDHLFGKVCLHRVRAICDVDNVDSARLLESLFGY